MFDHQFTARVALQVAGRQTTELSTFDRPGGGGYLSVGFGPVLIYCRTPRPVLIHHQAFSHALTAARGLFGPGYRAPLPVRSEQPPGHPVIAAITAHDDDACSSPPTPRAAPTTAGPHWFSPSAR